MLCHNLVLSQHQNNDGNQLLHTKNLLMIISQNKMLETEVNQEDIVFSRIRIFFQHVTYNSRSPDLRDHFCLKNKKMEYATMMQPQGMSTTPFLKSIAWS